MIIKFLVALLLCLQLVEAGDHCTLQDQQDYVDAAKLKFELCKLTKKFEELSHKVDSLSECCHRPPPTRPPQPPPKPSIPDNLPSCRDIKNRASWVTENKAYTLMVGGRKFQAYCHFGNIPGCGNGPWTMVMKLNGNSRTFHWNSHYWRNTNEYNPYGGRTGFDHQETKLKTYSGTPFSRICLGMNYHGATRWISIYQNARSLHSLIADGRYRRTSIGRNRWRSLIGDSSLQPYCNREGFNAQAENPPAAKARIGLIANDRDHPVCRTCDSFIGFGTSYPASAVMNSNSCGNEAIFNGDRGTKHHKAFGYILVQ